MRQPLPDGHGSVKAAGSTRVLVSAVLASVVAYSFSCSLLHAASLRYWVQACTKTESGCRASDPELAQWAMEAWQAASGGALRLEKVADEQRAHIRIYWANGNQGLYGETRPVTVNGIRGAEVYVLPMAGANGDDLLRETIVYLTCLHETGHALGLAHTDQFADIMYSFQFGGDIPEYFGRYRRLLLTREDIRKHAGMSDADRRRLISIYR